MSVLNELAEFVANAKFSEPNKIRMTRHLTDTAAAIVCGRLTPESSRLAGLYPQDDRHGLNEVLVNCAAARSTEIDDIHLQGCITPGSVIIPAALSMFKKCNRSIETFADAVLAGYEMICRLGRTVRGPEILYHGVWPTYLCAAFGTAALSARLLQMTESQTAHALALALTLSTGGVSRGDRLPFRWHSVGHAARSGCEAAIVAAEGFTGDPGMLEKNWFERTYGIQADLEALTKDLGGGSEIESVSLKPYCSARQAISAVEGLKRLIARGIRLEDMTAVSVFVPPPFVSMIEHKRPGSRMPSITSASYQMALAAFDHDGLYDMTRNRIRDSAEILAFMDKIRIVADPELNKHYPRYWPARLEVKTPRGTESETVLAAFGDPEREMDEGQFRDKIHRFLDPLAGERHTREIVRLGNDVFSSETSLLEFMRLLDNAILRAQSGPGCGVYK